MNNSGLTRRELLKSAAALPLLSFAAAGAASSSKANIILFVTDQERAITHFPVGWEQQNLPGLTRLKGRGLSFSRAYTNACMCSPARSTLMSGYFPAQHGVKYTLERDMPSNKYPQMELSTSLKNIGTVMSAAGYNVVYKGKWHCSKPSQGAPSQASRFVQKDLERYGFQRWDPPDAGANQDASEAGGGNADNDGRFMTEDGQWKAGKEGVLAFLSSAARAQQPFFLIVSLVNPHDVLFYPKSFATSGYPDSMLLGDIQIPQTNIESLDTKPSVQRDFLAISQIGLGALVTDPQRLAYLNFYGNLMKKADGYLQQVMAALDQLGLTDNTIVIRTADHGEMGLTHGGQRQKNFNFYEEACRVPLVYSNPTLYDRAYSTDALVSHVDFLPTLASLFHAPVSARSSWQGVDYSQIVLNPSAAPVQDYLVFTYDDFQSGQASGPYPFPPNHIASIREARYKLAEYYDPTGGAQSQWEMYDLLLDPLEVENIAWPTYPRTPMLDQELARLRAKLATVKATRLRPLS
ncbi:MAG: sulfatase-like hydrolase/transferase [Phycisphaerales bacterium]